jgi:transposase
VLRDAQRRGPLFRPPPKPDGLVAAEQTRQGAPSCRRRSVVITRPNRSSAVLREHLL